ncbi:MAG: hypothetical protein AB1331_03455 [Bacillota bacterium]
MRVFRYFAAIMLVVAVLMAIFSVVPIGGVNVGYPTASRDVQITEAVHQDPYLALALVRLADGSQAVVWVNRFDQNSQLRLVRTYFALFTFTSTAAEARGVGAVGSYRLKGTAGLNELAIFAHLEEEGAYKAVAGVRYRIPVRFPADAPVVDDLDAFVRQFEVEYGARGD